MILVGRDVHPTLREAISREGLDSVEGAFAHRGGEDLTKPNLRHRRRTRLVLTDSEGRSHTLFLKRYDSQGTWAWLRRILSGHGAAGPARTEFLNIQAVRAAGVPTMQEVICGEQTECCGIGRSYLLVTAAPGDALSRCGQEFLKRAKDRPQGLADFTRRLAGLVRSLHRAGLVHRDLYASHVFLDDSTGRADLCLIDLARVFRPRWRAFRWRVKDLAQLKYSMPGDWVAGHWDEFLTAYLDEPGAAVRYHRAVDRKVAAMRRRLARESA